MSLQIPNFCPDETEKQRADRAVQASLSRKYTCRYFDFRTASGTSKLAQMVMSDLPWFRSNRYSCSNFSFDAGLSNSDRKRAKPLNMVAQRIV